MKVDVLVRRGDVVFPGQCIRKADVIIQNGAVAGILAPGETVDAVEIIEAENKLVLPGCIDAHTHLTMGPGEMGYETETRSALYGGVTTTLSYYLDAGDLEKCLPNEIATGEAKVCGDFGLHPCIVTEGQLDALPRLVDRFGVCSFKFFMIFRGEEGAYLGIPGNDDGFLFKLLRAVKHTGGIMPCVHAENIELIWLLKEEIKGKGEDRLEYWDRARPDFGEAEATSRVLYYAEKAGSPIYVVHITCKDALEAIRRAKRKRPGMVFAETCTHYLTLTSENAQFPGGKVNPPLRSSHDVEALWHGIADGTIDVVGSDHVPRRFEHKKGGIWKASAGFPGTATMLPVYLNEGVRREIPVELLVAKVTVNPAVIFGLAPMKGSLLPGSDGDLVVVDPQNDVTITASALGSDADYTTYEGCTVNFMPTDTILRGRSVVKNSHFVGEAGEGNYLHRQISTRRPVVV